MSSFVCFSICENYCTLSEHVVSQDSFEKIRDVHKQEK